MALTCNASNATQMIPSGITAARSRGGHEQALAAARLQQAKSWELRAAMSMARLWRDQGKQQRAHDFDTLDLKEVKARSAEHPKRHRQIDRRAHC